MSQIPIGYTQSAGSNVLQTNPSPLLSSIIGDPTPAASYSRINGMLRAIFPYTYTKYPGHTGPLRSNGGG